MILLEKEPHKVGSITMFRETISGSTLHADQASYIFSKLLGNL